MSNPVTEKSYPLFQIQYWPYWLIIGVLRLFACLPYPLLLKMGKGIGLLMYRLSTKGRRTAEINIKLCFPEWTDVARKALLIKNFETAGISIMETALSWWGKEHQLQPLLKVYGREHIEQALAKGKGIILCSAHFMSLELTGRLFASQQPFAVIYRPQKNAVLDSMAKHYRRRIYRKIIARGDLRAMINYLKNNGVVWYTPDIDAGLKNSIFASFFNVPAATITATVRLADISQAQVLCAFPFRREDNSGYDLHIQAPLTDYPSRDPLQDATTINQLIETAIRLAPEQYLWQYKRFKTRPPGEARFYD